MTRRLAAAAVTLIVLGALAAAVAQALTPPPGTPDLAQMTLQPSDLAPGASATGAYVKPGKHVIAEYDSRFAAVATSTGVALEGIETQLLLADSSADARTIFDALRAVYGSKGGHALLARDVIASTGGKLTLKRKQFHFAKLVAIGVGDQSLLEAVTIHIKTRTLIWDTVALRVDGVVANVTIIAERAALAASVPTALAGAIAAHISSVLAAAGPSGPSGPSGATGASS